MNEEKKRILIRAAIIYITTALVGLKILYQVWHIQFAEGDHWHAQSEKITFKLQEVDAMRGNIFADDGTLLMTSVPIFDIYMDVAGPNISDAAFLDNVSALSTHLSSLLRDNPPSYYQKKLQRARRAGERYLLIKRNVTYNQLKAMRRFPLFNRGRFGGGFIVEPKTQRIKPYNNLASRTIGFVNHKSDSTTYVGIEGAYDEYLQGSKGKRLMQRVANGEMIPVNYKNQIEPQNGSDVHTTLDVNVQDVAESSLRRQLIRHDALYGTAIVMETRTGFIKAIANLGRVGEGRYGEIYNYAIGRIEAPGSTFKLASFLAALEDGVLPPLTDSIDALEGRKKFADRTMTDAHRGGFGKITVRQVFEKSSNIGVSTLITEGYDNPKKFIRSLEQFHLTDKLNLSLYGEKKPYIRDPESKTWSAVSLPWLSIGYESLLSPMHILTFYNAVANDGTMMKPQFVKSINNSGVPVKTFEPVVLEKAIASQRNIDTVKSLLRGVVERGTASNLRNTVYSIAGKTGTAQIANRNMGYNKRDYRASFVGYFPAEDPQYTIMVMVSNPSKGIYYGNIVAGSVFKDIADKIYATHVDIQGKDTGTIIADDPPTMVVGQRDDLNTIYQQLGYHFENPELSSEWAISMLSDDTLRYGHRIFQKEVVPNVKGMSGKDAIYLLEKMGLNIQVHGKGKVSRQSILAGTPITVGRTIILHLS
jgi:cell division protein FtsI (penicillin-binding protein 3)